MLGAQVIQLPHRRVEHDHAYHQIILGVKGRTEFEFEGRGNLVNHQVGCMIPSSLSHRFSGLDTNEILVLNISQASPEYSQLERAGLGECPEIFDQAGFLG